MYIALLDKSFCTNTNIIAYMHILDCTIRDGGYVIKNHWAPDILKKAVSALSSAGIRYIEIGVGLGLGAYRRTKDTLSDEDYMRLCLPHRGDSLIGMFFIPGIGVRCSTSP